MIESWYVKIPAFDRDKKRKAYVYLPAGYENGGRFPVMYMFDGHNLFSDGEATYGKSWGLSQYLDGNKTPLIIAAVECNHSGNERLSEYSPVNFERGGEKIKGRGKKYMDWLVKTFKPYIDANYNTMPDRKNTAVGGSSMGGLMTLYALSVYSKYFSRGAALSPSLWVYGGVPDFVKNAKYKADTRLYMDYGSKEFKNNSSRIAFFSETVSALIQKNVCLTSRIVPSGTHSEASWEKQIPYFINVLFGD